MRLSVEEFFQTMGRVRAEERDRVSTILAERDQRLVQTIGRFREEVKKTWDETLEIRRDVLMFLDELDPRDPVQFEKLKQRYPTMFKGGPT